MTKNNWSWIRGYKGSDFSWDWFGKCSWPTLKSSKKKEEKIKMKAIVAYNKNLVIGVDNDIPWKIQEDMNHFKETTLGHIVLMGKNTWNSIPDKFKPLKDRINLVLTSDPVGLESSDPRFCNFENSWASVKDGHKLKTAAYAIPGFESVRNFLITTSIPFNVYVIGGGQVYRQGIEEGWIDEIIASEVNGYDEIKEGVFFPKIDWLGELVESYSEFNVWRYKK